MSMHVCVLQLLLSMEMDGGWRSDKDRWRMSPYTVQREFVSHMAKHEVVERTR